MALPMRDMNPRWDGYTYFPGLPQQVHPLPRAFFTEYQIHPGQLTPGMLATLESLYQVMDDLKYSNVQLISHAGLMFETFQHDAGERDLAMSKAKVREIRRIDQSIHTFARNL
jgi:hypothetical protein